jgi:hypothetical protein
MGAMTMQREHAARAVGAASIVGYVGALAFAVGSGWYALAVKGVTVALPPEFTDGEPMQQKMETFYHWVATTLPQERAYTSLAIVGFVCLAVTTLFLRDSVGARNAWSTVGTALVVGAAALWIVGNVAQLGAHRAVGSMVTNSAGNTIQTSSAIFFTFETIDDAFELAAFTLLGVGLLTLAAGATRERAVGRGWSIATAALGAAMLATGVAYLVDNGDVVNDLLFLGGILLLPAWLAWSARLMGRSTARIDPNAI